MGDTRKKLGDFGEQVALSFLTRQGLREIERKWRCAQGEIDLVMRDGTELVFVEVRARRGPTALESVDARKQARLAALAYAYLEMVEQAAQMTWRIDVVALHIGRDGRVLDVSWVRHAVGEL